MNKERTITHGTKFCAVVGNPVGHSLSPAIYNASLDELGLDFVYLAFKVEDLKNALAGMRAIPNFRGMSVTIPHKMKVMEYLDEVGEVDRSIGSINTVINEDGKLVGKGTDGPAALKALADAGVDLNGKHVLMLGAGGVARAVAFTLARVGGISKLTLLDINAGILDGLGADLRNGTEVEIVARVMDDGALVTAMETADVIINCTPVGMHPRVNASLIPVELFRPGQVAFDVVYTPQRTKMLIDAASRGLQTVSGVEMFLNQAVLQFEHIVGVKPPVEVMRRVLLEKLK